MENVAGNGGGSQIVGVVSVPMMQGLLVMVVVRMGKVITPMVPLVTSSNWLVRVLFIFKVFLTEGGVPLAKDL